MISILGLDHAAVVAALYNASRPLGMGFMAYKAEPMTREQAVPLVGVHLDYVKGRVMKVCIAGDKFEEWGYDRDNGPGAALRVIEALRQTGDTSNAETEAMHASGKAASAAVTRCSMQMETTTNGPVVKLGLADVADVLEPKV